MAEEFLPSKHNRFSVIELVARIAVLPIAAGGIYLAATVFSSRALWICNPFPRPARVLVDGQPIEVPGNSVSKSDLGKKISAELAAAGDQKLLERIAGVVLDGVDTRAIETMDREE